jgi:hypothetical protein
VAAWSNCSLKRESKGQDILVVAASACSLAGQSSVEIVTRGRGCELSLRTQKRMVRIKVQEPKCIIVMSRLHILQENHEVSSL